MICSNADSRHRPCPHGYQDQSTSEFTISGKPSTLSRTCKSCKELRRTGRRHRVIKINISDMKPGNSPIFDTEEDKSRYYRWLLELAREVIKG